MNTHIRRIATGLCAAAVGALLIGTAAPATAAEGPFDPPTGSLRQVQQDATVQATPRSGPGTIGRVTAGESVAAFCAFDHAGTEWVKISLNDGSFGFIPSTAIAQGTYGLPSTCPSEVETVEFGAWAYQFGDSEFFVPVPAFTCPENYPYLSNFQELNFERLAPGVTPVRANPTGLVFDTGATIWDSNKRAVGYQGGTASNWSLEQYGGLLVSCTSNPEKAATRLT